MEFSTRRLKFNAISSEIPIDFGVVGEDENSCNVRIIPAKSGRPCGSQ